MLTTQTVDFATALAELQDAARPFQPLLGLDPQGYAQRHAVFESRSDQRDRITAWLVDTVAPRPGSATTFRVLSIGCGDGSVDVALARALALGGPVDYHGVEPHQPSSQLFLRRLAELQNVRVSVEAAPFDATSAVGGYDLIVAVHSLYYVPELRSALAAAHGLLAAGGRLVVVHAPMERLNSLVAVLAPGRTQEFSGAVRDAITERGWECAEHRIDATLDLGRGGGGHAGGGGGAAVDAAEADWRAALDFTVQAAIPDDLVGAVERALGAAAIGGDLLLAHPVDAFIVR